MFSSAEADLRLIGLVLQGLSQKYRGTPDVPRDLASFHQVVDSSSKLMADLADLTARAMAKPIAAAGEGTEKVIH